MILYKYCNQNGLNILRDLKIKITPPSEFNDPFEFLPTAQEKFSKKWAQEQIKIKTIQNELRIRFKKDGYYSGNKHQFKKYLEQRQDFALEYITQIYPQMQVFICRGMVDFCSERFGVFCLRVCYGITCSNYCAVFFAGVQGVTAAA